MSKEKSKEKLEYKEAKAIIIGNTFTSLLEPLTIDTPYLLLPICGIPIIEIMCSPRASRQIPMFSLSAQRHRPRFPPHDP